ncbi:MAG TPA: glucose 1-dehydrogenase [Gammaproteobacteria bacterium]|nr:glucose 1-dehydrogenase [Gammaproteobacteria bacterium]
MTPSASRSLAGKSCLVTGAAGGIGLAAAQALAGAGARLLLSDVDEARLAQVLADFRARGVEARSRACDVTDAASVQALVAQAVADYGRLDCAVNNAGVETRNAKLADHDDAEFDRALAVNLKGAYLCMKHELKQMLAQGGGVIVNVASVAGLGGAPTLAGYSASKHGVMGLTRSAAIEYAARGIRVNAVCPSYTNTDMVRRMLADKPNLRTALVNASPMKRLGEPAEIGHAIAWLCSEESSFVNGQGLALDGGLTAW